LSYGPKANAWVKNQPCTRRTYQENTNLRLLKLHSTLQV